jgi:hypothetical protein
MQWRKPLYAALLALAAVAGSSAAQAADKVRIGYWSSGVSLGFGAVLEATPFRTWTWNSSAFPT